MNLVELLKSLSSVPCLCYNVAHTVLINYNKKVENLVYSGKIEYFKVRKCHGKKVLRKSRKLFAIFLKKVAGIKCHEDSKIKMWREIKVAKWGKNYLKMHLIKQKSCNLLP